jgi:glucuronate isomerase
MKPFIHNNFLLGSNTAERLYHQYSANLPIIDSHCHLSAKMIAEDWQFEDLSQLWFGGDHYKCRTMRTNGIKEVYCTGNAYISGF